MGRLTRRSLLRTAALGAAAIPRLRAIESADGGASDSLLDEIERRGCRYFYDMADPETGLVLDRATIGHPYRPGVCSIAATGFGLSALVIADARQYLPRAVVIDRLRRTLRFLASHAQHERGFFYHFVQSSTGKRVWHSEASSIDTTWLLCGVLHVRHYWDDAEIRRLSTDILNRVEWPWMLNGQGTLSHGWTPESKFLPYRWDRYAEVLAMYLLAMVSPAHPIPASSWTAWSRPLRDYSGIFYIDPQAPLFVHQYSHAWFDFRDRRDSYANYFRNSQRATQAHRQYCMALASQFPWYGPGMWGVTASDSRGGYRVWGLPSSPPDGTLVPCAAGGSLAFLPGLCGAVLENMRARYGEKVWSPYGFVDAFHPQQGWYSPDVIGIDIGIMVLMAENTRSGAIWDAIMATPEAKRSFELAGLLPIAVATK